MWWLHGREGQWVELEEGVTGINDNGKKYNKLLKEKWRKTNRTEGRKEGSALLVTLDNFRCERKLKASKRN